jgi:hypothetical protein
MEQLLLMRSRFLAAAEWTSLFTAAGASVLEMRRDGASMLIVLTKLPAQSEHP